MRSLRSIHFLVIHLQHVFDMRFARLFAFHLQSPHLLSISVHVSGCLDFQFNFSKYSHLLCILFYPFCATMLSCSFIRLMLCIPTHIRTLILTLIATLYPPLHVTQSHISLMFCCSYLKALHFDVRNSASTCPLSFKTRKPIPCSSHSFP